MTSGRAVTTQCPPSIGTTLLPNGIEPVNRCSAGVTNTSFRGIAFTPNEPPVVTTSGGSTSYTENAAATAIDANLTVSDANSTNLAGATVKISSGYVNGEVIGVTGGMPLS